MQHRILDPEDENVLNYRRPTRAALEIGRVGMTRCCESDDVDCRASPVADAAFRVEAESALHPATFGRGRIKLWCPGPREITRDVCDGAAACLSTAFSSGGWSEIPMPMGDETDPQSAVGIIAGL